MARKSGFYDAAQAWDQIQQRTTPQQQQPQQESMPSPGGAAVPPGSAAPSQESGGGTATPGYTTDNVETELEEQYGMAATAEEQEQYDKYVSQVMERIWAQEGTGQMIADMKQHAQTLGPAEVIGGMAAELVEQADNAFNGEIEEDLLVPIGNELVEQLTELAGGANALQVDDRTPTQASMYMITQLMQKFDIDRNAMRSQLKGMNPAHMERAVSAGFGTANNENQGMYAE